MASKTETLMGKSGCPGPVRVNGLRAFDQAVRDEFTGPNTDRQLLKSLTGITCGSAIGWAAPRL